MVQTMNGEGAGPPPMGTVAEWRDELRATLALGWPLVLSNLAHTIMIATDLMMIGRLGADQLAASALGANVYFLFLMFSIGFLNALAPLLASERGRRRHSVRELRRTVAQGFWATAILSMVSLAALWAGEHILLALRQEPQLAAEGGRYLRALAFALPSALAFIVLRSFLSALERPLAVLVVAIAGVVVNVGLNYALIFGHFGAPALGIVGSGVATSLTNLLMAAALALFIAGDRRLRRYRLFQGLARSDRARFLEIARLGLPLAGTLVFEAGIFNAAVFLMGLIDRPSLAAHAIAIQIAALAFMVPLGVAQAASVRVGVAFGARDGAGVARAGWTAFALGLGFMSLTALVMLIVPRPLIGAFIDTDDPVNAAVLAHAVAFLAIGALFQLADGAQAVGSGMLRGLQDVRAPMLFALFGYWGVGLPLGALLAFPLGLGGVGVWIGLAVGLAIVAALMMARWMMRQRLGLAPALDGGLMF